MDCISCTGLSDFAVAVHVETVDLLDLLDQVAERVLSQLKLFFKGLDAILNGIGFSLLTIHQTGLHDFPKNPHF
jgi:hypothetical protein